MAQFTVNTTRFDPYKHMKFRVMWDGRAIPGISKVSALKRTTEVIQHREGGDPSLQRRSPGLTAYEPIVLVRGRTHDNEFEDWANKTWLLGAAAGAEVSLKDFRKDVVINLLNEAGQLVIRFKIFRCWPSEYIALDDLDADNTSIACEMLTLQNEGWERDTAIVEPAEPSFTNDCLTNF